ncbi:helix-turn-helix domain-containing protein, partial [Sulfuriflexus sp.]|uniref:helix-turn-helix domain-containing protein n=1 Tax=Sulfuriflexus sp. TaxID=2015443 RepID=UPI0028CEFCAA
WNISEKAKILFSWFYLYKDKDDGCWASNSFLARNTGVDPRSISRYISALEDWGYIKVKNRDRTNKRRVYLGDFEKIYSEVADEIYSNRRSPNPLNFEEDKQLFKNALDSWKKKIDKNLVNNPTKPN